MSTSVDRAEVRAELVKLVRRLAVESQRLGHVFAARNGLHGTDFEALIHILDGEQDDSPITPGQLAHVLGLSSGATTSVVDRLERDGHVKRDRDTADRRRVHLRFGDVGWKVAIDFFRPMVPMTDTVMEQFSDEDLLTVMRFLGTMTDATANYRRSLGSVREPRERNHATAT